MDGVALKFSQRLSCKHQIVVDAFNTELCQTTPLEPIFLSLHHSNFGFHPGVGGVWGRLG
jgi:hypothetical protein